MWLVLIDHVSCFYVYAFCKIKFGEINILFVICLIYSAGHAEVAVVFSHLQWPNTP